MNKHPIEGQVEILLHCSHFMLTVNTGQMPREGAWSHNEIDAAVICI